MKETLAKLSKLIEQAEKGELEPKELSATALSIGREALGAKRAWVSNGKKKSYPQPEYGHALRSLEVAAHLAGLAEKSQAEGSKSPGLDAAAMKRAGLRLVAEVSSK